MTHIPLCSLSDEALADRIEAWDELGRAALARRRTATGAELRFPLERAVAERLVELIGAEAACCPGLRLDATITVTISAPEGQRTTVGDLFAPTPPDQASGNAMRR